MKHFNVFYINIIQGFQSSAKYRPFKSFHVPLYDCVPNWKPCLNIDKILRNVTASQLGSGINLAYALYRETAKT